MEQQRQIIHTHSKTLYCIISGSESAVYINESKESSRCFTAPYTEYLFGLMRWTIQLWGCHKHVHQKARRTQISVLQIMLQHFVHIVFVSVVKRAAQKTF